MSQESAGDPHAQIVPATEVGWIRLPQRETPEYDVWLRPDGALVEVAKGIVPRVWKPGDFGPPARKSK